MKKNNIKVETKLPDNGVIPLKFHKVVKNGLPDGWIKLTKKQVEAGRPKDAYDYVVGDNKPKKQHRKYKKKR